MITIYGIKNCDTIKKARRWLEENAIDFRFHDYRKDGLDEALLEKLEAQAGWEKLLNKRGTTWRKLDESARDSINRESALALMLEQPALIKRPVLVKGDTCLVGFDPASYEKL